MTTNVQFHEAAISVAVKVIDGDRVVDVQRFQLAVLLDSDGEWQNAIALIREQMAQLEAQHGDNGNAETGEPA